MTETADADRPLEPAGIRAQLRATRAALRAGNRQRAEAAAGRAPRWQSARIVARSAPLDEALPSSPDVAVAAEPPQAALPPEQSIAMEACDAGLPPAAATEVESVAEPLLAQDSPPPDALVIEASPLPDEDEPEAATTSGEAVSVFASLVRAGVDSAVRTAPAEDPVEASTEAHAESPAAALPEETAAPVAPAPPAPASADLCTMAILGPGMRARLRLLGYADLLDLARADPARLREELGDISRFLNINAWVDEARRLSS